MVFEALPSDLQWKQWKIAFVQLTHSHSAHIRHSGEQIMLWLQFPKAVQIWSNQPSLSPGVWESFFVSYFWQVQHKLSQYRYLSGPHIQHHSLRVREKATSLPWKSPLTLVGTKFDYHQRHFAGRNNVLNSGVRLLHWLPISSGQSQRAEREGCLREKGKEGTPVQRWTLIDVWQLLNVYKLGIIHCGRGICGSKLNMESAVWEAKAWTFELSL